MLTGEQLFDEFVRAGLCYGNPYWNQLSLTARSNWVCLAEKLNLLQQKKD